MKKLTYWSIFWGCLLGNAISAALTFIGAWKFADEPSTEVLIPYFTAVPLNIVSAVIFALLVTRTKPFNNKAS